MVNEKFCSLNSEELEDINGGGFWIAVGLGALSCFVYEVANEKVKRDTGKTIIQHGADAINGAIDSFKK